jgi:hypothetical protein
MKGVMAVSPATASVVLPVGLEDLKRNLHALYK